MQRGQRNARKTAEVLRVTSQYYQYGTQAILDGFCFLIKKFLQNVSLETHKEQTI
jgi:hypothetical protein